MATTTNYSWTTPDDTGLVKDGASAIRTLGSAIDTTTKNLNPSTTLGDIEYRSSTANTNTRLGIGTTGQVLTVSGGVPTWATSLAGGDPRQTIEQSTYWIGLPFYGTASASQTPVTNTTYYYPIFVSAMSVDRIGFNVPTYTTTGNTRLGVYNMDSAGKPSTVLFDAGVVSVTTGGEFTITISQSFATAGWYYIAINRQSGDYIWSGRTVLNSITNTRNITTLPSGNTAPLVGYTQASVTGAFGTAASLSVNTATNAVDLGLRIA